MIASRWFVPIVVFLVGWGLTTHGKYSVSGDEPHYLIVSQSLLADGDIDLENNHAAGDSRQFGVENLAPGPHVRESPRGRLLPVHDIGLPLALMPVYAAATGVSSLVSEPLLGRFRMSRGLFAYSLITLFLLAITASAAQLTRTALAQGGTSIGVATTVVLTAWLSPPVLSNGYLVFPEVMALFATAWVACRSAEAATRPMTFGRWAAPIACLGLLPLFHRKYAPYVAAVAVALLWRHRADVARFRPSERLAAIAALTVPLGGLLLWTWWQWGNVSGALAMDRPPFSWDALRIGWVGMLIDRENGLWTWAPVYALLPVAFVLAGRAAWPWLLPIATLFLVSAAHDQWWGGFSPAARFLVPIVPLCCLAAPALLGHRVSRFVAVCVLVPQLAIAAYGWQVTRALWPQGDGHNRVIGPLLELVGGNEGFLPALRVEPGALVRALLLVALVVAFNVGLWLIVRRHELDLSPDASRRVG